jgi:excisionase family DNA binding protein
VGDMLVVSDDNAVLDAEAAAALLHVSVKTVVRLAREGELPARKVGREWRFARAALLDHLAGGGVGE